MNTKQKVRAMRKFARNMIDIETMAAMEMRAFGAPSECWDLITPGLQQQTENAFKQLGLSSSDWNDEMRLYISQEAQHSGGWEPMAFLEWSEIEGLMSPYSG